MSKYKLLILFIFSIFLVQCSADRLSDGSSSEGEGSSLSLWNRLVTNTYELDGLSELRADLDELCSSQMATTFKAASKNTSINEFPPEEGGETTVTVSFDTDSFVIDEGDSQISGTWDEIDDDTISVNTDNGVYVELDVVLDEENEILYIFLNSDFTDYDCSASE